MLTEKKVIKFVKKAEEVLDEYALKDGQAMVLANLDTRRTFGVLMTTDQWEEIAAVQNATANSLDEALSELDDWKLRADNLGTAYIGTLRNLRDVRNLISDILGGTSTDHNDVNYLIAKEIQKLSNEDLGSLLAEQVINETDSMVLKSEFTEHPLNSVTLREGVDLDPSGPYCISSDGHIFWTEADYVNNRWVEGKFDEYGKTISIDVTPEVYQELLNLRKKRSTNKKQLRVMDAKLKEYKKSRETIEHSRDEYVVKYNLLRDEVDKFDNNLRGMIFDSTITVNVARRIMGEMPVPGGDVRVGLLV